MLIPRYSYHLCSLDDFRRLFHAAWVGNRDIVQCLVDYRADPNIQNNRQNSPLHLAFERMNRGAMLVLVENGADIDLKNSWGQKPYEVKLKDNVNPGILELNKLEELLKDARRKYLDSHSHEVEDTITDEEVQRRKKTGGWEQRSRCSL